MAEVKENAMPSSRSGSFSREFNLRLKTKYILHERLVWLSVCNMALAMLHSRNDSCNFFHNFSFVVCFLSLRRLLFFFIFWHSIECSMRKKWNQVRADSIGHDKYKWRAMQGFNLVYGIHYRRLTSITRRHQWEVEE